MRAEDRLAQILNFRTAETSFLRSFERSQAVVQEALIF